MNRKIMGALALALCILAGIAGTRSTAGMQDVLSYKSARINCSADDCVVVAAKTGSKIRVVAAYLNAGGDTTINFQTGTGDTFLSGPWMLGGAGEPTGLGLPFIEAGHFTTAESEALEIDTDAVTVGGHVVYEVID